MNRPFLALLLTLFAGGFAASPIRTLLPAYVEEVLRRPPLLTSVLLAIQLGTGGAFALLAGTLSARFGQRGAVLIGLTTPVFGALLFALTAPPLLCLAAVFWGVAAGFHSAGGQSFMIAAVRRERLGTASATYFLSSTASGALGAYAAGLAADHLGYGAVALAAAGVGIVALLLASIWLPAMPGPPAAHIRAGSHAPTSYAALLAQPEVRALCALRYFPTVAWGAASLTIPVLLFRLAGGSASTLGAYGMVSLLCASAGQLATGRLIDARASSGAATASAPIRPLLAPLTAAILLSASVAAAGAHAQSLPALFAAGTLWTVTAWALSTTMPPLIRELGGSSDRLVGLAHLMWSAGMLSGTLGAGLLIDLHPVAPFILALTCLVATFGAAVWVTSRPRAAYAT